MSEDEYLDKLFVDADSKMLETGDNDSIAEPFYFLLEELFELRGMKKWFRKSLILFVQLTYGANINRAIRQSIYWLLSDQMVAFYLKQLKDSFWKLNADTNQVELVNYDNVARSEEEKAQTKKLAKLKLIENIPGKLTSTVYTWV